MLNHLPSVALTEHPATTPEMQQQIEQYLYSEAQLLDNHEFDQWFELLAEDLHYYMPTRYNRTKRAAGQEFSSPNEVALFDEDKQSMSTRIRRLHTGMAWAEEPASRTRHMISNVQIHPTANPNEIEVDCCFMLYRSRLERDVDIFVGGRRDLLRQADNKLGWKIVKRAVALDQTTVLASNLSIFF